MHFAWYSVLEWRLPCAHCSADPGEETQGEGVASPYFPISIFFSSSSPSSRAAMDSWGNFRPQDRLIVFTVHCFHNSLTVRKCWNLFLHTRDFRLKIWSRKLGKDRLTQWYMSYSVYTWEMRQKFIPYFWL